MGHCGVGNKLGGLQVKILTGCEHTGAIRDACRDLGHDAWSCDLLPDLSFGPHAKFHIQADVRSILTEGWDAATFNPPCTYQANSGVRWLEGNNPRWKMLVENALLFKECLDAPIPKIAMENPILHKYAFEVIGRKPDQIIQPWMFGTPETKATCLWLKNLPHLVPTDIVPKSSRYPRVHLESPGADRWQRRSRTDPNIAAAMAAQWFGAAK